MRWALRSVRAASFLVPLARRTEWVEEWTAELEALDEARSHGRDRLPGPLGFSLGAWRHAVWMRTEGWTMDSVLRDVRYAGRILSRAPAFTLVAAVTLALGIGANASMFSLINGLMIRPPTGVQDGGRLVQIGRSYESNPGWDNFSWPNMEAIREAGTVFEGVAGYRWQSFVIGEGEEADQVAGQLVTGNYFEVLGVDAAVGRTLQPEDDVMPGAHRVVVVGHGYWSRRFGEDPDVIGTSLLLGGVPYEIVGVASEGFQGVEPIGAIPEIFAPTAMHPPHSGRLPFTEWGWSWINLVGRLSDGVSFEGAQAAMEVVTARVREAHPYNEDLVLRLSEGVGLDPNERAAAKQLGVLLLGVVGLVLLITCANVANLFVARATTRAAEMGVRRALGAGTGRLARQLVTESVVLAMFATALAWPLVHSSGRFLPALMPYRMALSLDPDWRVFAFLIGSGILAGLLFGTAPALAAVRRDVALTLREGNTTGGRAHTRYRDALVVAQLALSLGLLTGAALLGRSLVNARTADPGFDARGILVGKLDLGLTGRYDPESAIGFYGRLLSAVENLPGVRAATLASSTPIIEGQDSDTRYPADMSPDVRVSAESFHVGPGYFETLGIRVLRGRSLRDLTEEPDPVVVINETLANIFWPDDDPIGKELEGVHLVRVVGVVSDIQTRSLRSRPRPAVYEPLTQTGSLRVTLHVRVAGPPMDLARPVHDVLGELDPGLPLTGVRDLHSSIGRSLAETRTFGMLMSAFAALALALSIVGLYGLVSFGVSQRIREMGIRVALGAEPSSLVRMMLKRGLALAVVGVIGGLGISYVLGQALESLLYGVTGTDVPAVSSAALLLLAAAGLAAWLPARRASRVDAAVSLREE